VHQRRHPPPLRWLARAGKPTKPRLRQRTEQSHLSFAMLPPNLALPRSRPAIVIRSGRPVGLLRRIHANSWGFDNVSMWPRLASWPRTASEADVAISLEALGREILVRVLVLQSLALWIGVLDDRKRIATPCCLPPTKPERT
jgi:hypothetical protein